MTKQKIETSYELATRLARPLDLLVREIMAMRTDFRAARAVSKVILQLKLEALEERARQMEAVVDAICREADHG